MVYVPWMQAADRIDVLTEGAMHLLDFHSEHCVHEDNTLKLERDAVRIKCDRCNRGAAIEGLREDEPHVVALTVMKYGTPARMAARKVSR